MEDLLTRNEDMFDGIIFGFILFYVSVSLLLLKASKMHGIVHSDIVSLLFICTGLYHKASVSSLLFDACIIHNMAHSDTVSFLYTGVRKILLK